MQYHMGEKEGSPVSNGLSYTHIPTAYSTYQEEGIANGGHGMVNGFPCMAARGPVMFQSDADDDDQRQCVPLTSDEQQPAEASDTSITSIHRLHAGGGTDTLRSCSSAGGARSNLRNGSTCGSTGVLQTFHPHAASQSSIHRGSRDSLPRGVGMVHVASPHKGGQGRPQQYYHTMEHPPTIREGFHNSRPPEDDVDELSYVGDHAYNLHRVPPPPGSTFHSHPSYVHSHHPAASESPPPPHPSQGSTSDIRHSASCTPNTTHTDLSPVASLHSSVNSPRHHPMYQCAPDISSSTSSVSSQSEAEDLPYPYDPHTHSMAAHTDIRLPHRTCVT